MESGFYNLPERVKGNNKLKKCAGVLNRTINTEEDQWQGMPNRLTSERPSLRTRFGASWHIDERDRRPILYGGLKKSDPPHVVVYQDEPGDTS